MYKKWWYLLFLSLTTHEQIHSRLLSDFQDGKSVWLLFALGLGQHFLRDTNYWNGWVSAGLCSKLFCSSEHIPKGISLLAIRYGLCQLRYGSLVLWLSPFTHASSLSGGYLEHALPDKLMTHMKAHTVSSAPWTMQWKQFLCSTGGFLQVTIALRSP